jgi:hypothetical protein
MNIHDVRVAIALEQVVIIFGSSGICSQSGTCARKEPFNSLIPLICHSAD